MLFGLNDITLHFGGPKMVLVRVAFLLVSLIILFVPLYASGRLALGSILAQRPANTLWFQQNDIGPEVDNAINAATYPMTVLGGWPLENMSAGTTQLIGPSTDNGNSALASIGFTFRFDNMTFTHFGANGNGFISLGTAPFADGNINVVNSTLHTPRIMPYWDDLCVGSNGKVHYKTVDTGVARKLIVEWKNMQISRNGQCTGPGTGTFQLWLVERLGVIQFVYGSGMNASAAADGGYSVGIQALSPGNFASITTSNSTVNYFTGNNTQTDGIPTGVSYVFAPAVPSTPGNGSVTSVTQFSLILNWTDNATNETMYEIYRSTDNVNFTQHDILPPNSIQYIDDELVPGTQYFYRIYATAEGATSFPLSLQATALPAGNISSTASGGMWSVPSTWVGGVMPQAGDHVTISDGALVTIDTAAVALSLKLGTVTALADPEEKPADNEKISVDVDIEEKAFGPTTARLTFEETAPHTLTVGQNVLVNQNGIFATFGLGNVTGHVMSVGGNLTNNGALDFSTNNNQAGAIIEFTGASNALFHGSGSTTDVRTINVNKGGAATSILELAPANFTVQGSSTDTPASGYLNLTSGTFKISGTFSGNHRTFQSALYAINAGSGIWLNNPNYTVAAQNGSVTLNAGHFRITRGTYNVGTVAGNSIGFRLLASAIIEGGTVNVAGRFGVSGATEMWQYQQTGGTINTCTFGDSSPALACFDAGANTDSTFTMTAGEIVVQNSNGSLSGIDYRHQAGTTGAATVVGGTVRFGNASTTGFGGFRGVGVMPDMIVDNISGGSHTFTFGTVGVLPNLTRNVTITAGAAFLIGNGAYIMNGSTFVNNGTLSAGGLSSDFVWANPVGNRTYSGTGALANIVNRFTILGQSLTFSSTNNVRVRNLILISGDIINANKLTIGNNDNIVSLVQIGSADSPTPAGTFDSAPVFQLGSGGQDLRYMRTGAMRTTGPELNSARSLASLTYDNNDAATDELTIAGGNLIVNGILNLANGEIKTGANQLTHNGAVVRNTGYVNGTYSRNIIVSGSYFFPVGVNGYSPVSLLVDGVTSPGQTVTVKAVDAVLPGLDPATSASRYWEVTKSGSFAGQLNFTYTDADINGDENNYGAWVSRNGLNPVLESPANNPGNNRVSTSGSLVNLTGNWSPGCCSVPRTLAGTVRDANGFPLRNATLRLSGGGLPQPIFVNTGSLGGYLFQGVISGRLYSLTVGAKRYRFTPSSRDIVLAGDDTTQDFTANPQE